MTRALTADEPMALFVADGDLLVPTEFARGPWSPDSLHGGPVAVVGAAESALWDAEGRIGRAVQDLYVEPAR